MAHKKSEDASVVKYKRTESQPSYSGLGKKQKTSTHQRFQGQGRGYQGQCQGRLSPGGRSFRAYS